MCETYGFCLSPLWQARLRDNPPKSVARFTDTVFHAEGLDPAAADSKMYKEMLEVVRLAFARSAEVARSMPSNTSFERTREK